MKNNFLGAYEVYGSPEDYTWNEQQSMALDGQGTDSSNMALCPNCCHCSTANAALTNQFSLALSISMRLSPRRDGLTQGHHSYGVNLLAFLEEG